MEPDSRTRFGFIAREVKEVLPELVVEDENGYLSADYPRVHTHTRGRIQES